MNKLDRFLEGKAFRRFVIQNTIILVVAIARLLDGAGYVDMSGVMGLLDIAMWGSIFLVYGAIFYERDAHRESKQAKRDEHERIDRLIEPPADDNDTQPIERQMRQGKR